MALIDTDVVTLRVTIQTAGGEPVEVVNAQLNFGYAAPAIVAALQSILDGVQTSVRTQLEQAAAGTFNAAEAPITAAQAQAFAALDALRVG